MSSSGSRLPWKWYLPLPIVCLGKARVFLGPENSYRSITLVTRLENEQPRIATQRIHHLQVFGSFAAAFKKRPPEKVECSWIAREDICPGNVFKAGNPAIEGVPIKVRNTYPANIPGR